MKRSIIICALAIGFTAQAQKKNETSAAVEYKNNFMSAMMNGEMDKAKKSLIKAKEFVDLAATNPETENSPKTLYLKGEIYSSFLMIGMQTMDTAFVRMAGENAFDVAIESYKKGYSVSDKYDGDIKESVYQKHDMIDQFAVLAYNAGMFEQAAEVYDSEAKLYDALNMYDTTSVFNKSLCYEKAEKFEKAALGYEDLAKHGSNSENNYLKASYCYRLNKQDAIAVDVLKRGLDQNPKSVNLLIDYVNLKIDLGDTTGIGTIVSDIQTKIQKEPKNKDLHFVLARIYMGQKKNDLAVSSFDKVLEIDPEYEFANYFLGFQLYFMASDLEKEKNALKPKDPKMFPIIEKMDQYSYRAIEKLEKYIIKNPNDKNTLLVLSNLYTKISDKYKADEYMQRANAIK